MLAVDERGIVIEANTSAAALFGRARDEVIGAPLPSFFSADDAAAVDAACASAATTAASLTARVAGGDRCALALRAIDGSPLRLAVTVAPMLEDPTVLRLPFGVVGLRPDLHVAFVNDLARALLGETMQAGAQLDEAAPRLVALGKNLVASAAPVPPTEVELGDGRTVRVAGVAASAAEPAVLLVEDVTALQRQQRVMGEFLRNAAHQLRTPLTGIIAAIETLQSGAKETPADRDLFLGHVESHANRLARLARGLLLLARLEMGETVAVDFVELRPLLDHIAGDASPREGVVIASECPRGLAAVGSPDLLQEAVAALVDNAVAHTEQGEIRITAHESDGHVTVRVADTGPGIRPEFRERVFEPFFRDGASGENYGLGLAIALQAVRAMRGDIDVSSVPGAGTEFSMTLPAATVVR